MSDLTMAMYQHSVLFLSGMLLYLLLTLEKLYLHYHYAPPDYINKASFKLFVKNLAWAHLFLFIFKRNTWIPEFDEGYKKPKLKMVFVNGLRQFLKPYLIIGFFWYFLEILIFIRFNYVPLTITLGQVQLLINFINKLPLVHYLAENDKLIFVLLGLTFIYIPVLYNYKKKFDSFKAYAGDFLIYLAIGSSISLFGTPVGKIVATRTKQLVQLELQIRAIHDSIFVETTRLIIARNFGETIQHNEDSVKNELTKFTDQIKEDAIQKDFAFDDKQSLNDTLSVVISNILKENTLIAELKRPQVPYKATLTPGEKMFTSYVNNTGRGREDNFGSYMAHENNWNIRQGSLVLQKIRAEELVVPKNRNSILKETIEVLTDYLLGIEIDAGLEALKVANMKFMGKVLELISNATVIEKINETLYKFFERLGKHKSTQPVQIITEAPTLYMSDRPPVLDYRAELATAKTDFQRVSTRLIREHYVNVICQKLKLGKPSGIVYDQNIDAYTSSLLDILRSKNIIELRSVNIATNNLYDYLEILQILRTKKIISSPKFESGEHLYFRMNILNMATEKLEGIDYEDLQKRIEKMDIKHLQAFSEISSVENTPVYLDQLNRIGNLSNKELIDQKRTFYTDQITKRVNELATSDQARDLLKNKLIRRLVHRNLADLVVIYESSKNVSILYGWLSNLEELGKMSTQEVEHFHPVCSCYIGP